MSKSKKGIWGDPFDLNDDQAGKSHYTEDTDGETELQSVGQLMNEAHEALSKLYNKSHKRGKTQKGGRRGEAWR